MTEVMMEKERSEATLAVPDEFDAVDEQLVEQLTDRARSQGLELTGAGPGSPDEPRAGDGAHPLRPRGVGPRPVASLRSAHLNRLPGQSESKVAT